jgi:triacylglycerol lipase
MSTIKKAYQILFVLMLILFLFIQATFASHKVYVIHGYGGSLLQMEKINQRLIQDGFHTENYSYPGFTKNLDSIGIELFRKVQKENFDTISFVTHSMGALVVRSMVQYLDSAVKFPFIFRIVMLAPPNKGTQLADMYSGPVTKFLLGPNVEYMKTDSDSYVNHLPIPNCEVGIIAGIRGKKPWYNPFLKEDNDGNVSYSLTLLGNEKEIVKVKSTHGLMTQKNKVIKLVITFIKTGSFKKSN